MIPKDDDIEETTCPGCGVKVIVGKTPDGKRVVLNPVPKPEGTYYFGERGYLYHIEEIRRHAVSSGQRAGKTMAMTAPRFVEHARTCPQRELFGKGT